MNNRRVFPFAGLILLLLFSCSGCSLWKRADSTQYIESGKKFLAGGDYPRAILQFRNALQKKPNSAEAHYQLGRVYLAMGDWNLAAAHFSRATELDPGHRDAQLKLSELLATTEERTMLEEANRRLRSHLATQPGDAEALSALGITEWKLSRPADAEAHLQEAFRRAPDRLDSAVALARLKMQRGDMAGAEQVLTTAAARPNAPNAMVALGEFYFMNGKPEAAEAEFQRILASWPANAMALFDLAALRVHAGDLVSAEKYYARLSALPAPEYKPAHALFLLETGHADQAIAELKTLVAKDPENRRMRSGLVQALLTARRRREAADLLSTALRANPKDSDALLQRSALELASENFNAAESDLNQALRFRPEFAEAHYMLARLDDARGNELLERQEYSEALRLKQDFLKARCDLAALFIRQGAANAALGILDEAPEEQKRLTAYIAQRNWALIAAGRSVEAQQIVEQALAKNADSPEFRLQDAALKTRRKQYAAARESLRVTLRQDPDDVRALALLARTWEEQQQSTAAVNEIRSWASRRPQSAPVQLFLGKLLLENGNADEARKAFVAARAADPDLIIADLSIIQADIKAGRWQQAHSALDDLIRANGEHVIARLWLGHLEELAGNHQAAVAHYRRVLAIDTDNTNALNNLAYLLAENGGQIDEALKYAQKAAELQPDVASVQDTLGWVLYRKGMYDMAVPHLEASVKTDPSARHTAHLALAYMKTGHEAQGREDLRLASQMDPNLPELKQAATLSGDRAAVR